MQTYKSLLFPCNLEDGLFSEVCRYDIAANTIERLKNSENTPLVIRYGPGGASELLEHDGVLYISGFAWTKRGIWRYNYTSDSTLNFIDLDSPDNFPVTNLTISNGSLYFVTKSDDNIGLELHKYHIATDKASLAADINDGANNSDINYSHDRDGGLYCSAAEGSPHERGTYDTATDKADMAVEVYPGNPSSFVDYMINVNGTLYFAAIGTGIGLEDYNLWSYNPSTEVLLNLSKSFTISLPIRPEEKGVITEVNNMIYFQGRNDSLTDKGYELYKYDIAQDKVFLAADINKTTGGDSSSSPVEMIAAHEILYFSADDDIHGRELWKYDLSMEQASLAYDINSGGKDSHSNPSALVEVNDVLYFSADDGVNGRELYRCTKDEGCSITRNMNGPASTLYQGSVNEPMNIIGSTF